MRTPKEIYEAYKLMPNLQQHQLRVAAVGKLICDNFKESLNVKDIILACLFHDMGNILKFELSYFPEFLEPEGLTYWEGVKEEYRKKYGADQHVASEMIAREIGLSDNVIRLISLVTFSGLLETLKEPSFEPKIIEYADCRVAPHGVVSVRERFVDGRKRYLHRFNTKERNDAHYDALTEAGYEVEQQIFAQCSIVPEDVTDEAIAPLIEKLWEYPVA